MMDQCPAGSEELRKPGEKATVLKEYKPLKKRAAPKKHSVLNV
jgi:hypothetical protein